MTSTVSLMKTGLCGALALLALVGTADAQEHLSGAADPAGGRLRRRRADRHPGALHRRQARHALGQRVIVENKTGARRHGRDPRRAGAAARRLYPAALHALRVDQHRRLQESCSSSSADLAPISLIAKYYYGLALANADSGRHLRDVRAIRQGASRRDELRHHRRRLGAGDPGAAAGKARRHHHEPDSVPRRSAGDAGTGRRARSTSTSRRPRRSCRNTRPSSSRSWR